MTLTFKLDPDSVSMNHRVKSHLFQKSLFGHVEQKDSHTGPTDQSEPLT